MLWAQEIVNQTNMLKIESEHLQLSLINKLNETQIDYVKLYLVARGHSSGGLT